MKGQLIKGKSIKDAGVIIPDVAQLGAKEPEGIIPDSKPEIKISINEGNWKVWEELYDGLRDKFH